MNSAELKNKISDLRPNYSDKYRSMIETISNKQEKIGKGNIAQFGPYFQTFMYAFVIGLRLGSPKYFESQEKTWEFAPLFRWKPEPIKDYIIMMLLNRSADYGYNWIDLENADDVAAFEVVTCPQGLCTLSFQFIQDGCDADAFGIALKDQIGRAHV